MNSRGAQGWRKGDLLGSYSDFPLRGEGGRTKAVAVGAQGREQVKEGRWEDLVRV